MSQGSVENTVSTPTTDQQYIRTPAEPVRPQNQRDDPDRQHCLSSHNGPESARYPSVKNETVDHSAAGYERAFEPACKIATGVMLEEWKTVPKGGNEQTCAAKYTHQHRQGAVLLFKQVRAA